MNGKKTNRISPKKSIVHPVMKKRRLRLARAQSSRNAVGLAKRLRTQQGVKSVVVEDHFVFVDYDLMQISEQRIEQEIIASGEKLADYMLEKLRRSWIHYIEDTELENSKITHSACCNRPPPGA